MTEPLGPTEGTERVIRSGCYHSHAHHTASWIRHRRSASCDFHNADAKHDLGFRVAFTVLPGGSPFDGSPMTYYVDAATGKDVNDGLNLVSAKKTIQAAVDLAVDGDKILVSAGTYEPFMAYNKSTEIRSICGAKKTLIDGGSDSGVRLLDDANATFISVNNKTNTLLVGFTVQRCKWITGGTVRNCIVCQNNASAGGAPMMFSIVENCLILNNVGSNGGAGDNCRFKNCTIVGNSAPWPYSCAALNCVLENCIVYGNADDSSGTWEDWLRPMISEIGYREVNVCREDPIVNYVLNSVTPDCVVPLTGDVGLVNIIAEVKGGLVTVPESWSEEFPTFASVFGSDFSKALAMKSGKKDGAGNEMYVWQDFVAGTDPTNPSDTFKASITFDPITGRPVISWSPELIDKSGTYLRKYTVNGKVKLNDEGWEREGLAVSRVLASPLNVLLAPCGMNYVNCTKKDRPVFDKVATTPAVLVASVLYGACGTVDEILVGTFEMLTTMKVKQVYYPWETDRVSCDDMDKLLTPSLPMEALAKPRSAGEARTPPLRRCISAERQRAAKRWLQRCVSPHHDEGQLRQCQQCGDSRFVRAGSDDIHGEGVLSKSSTHIS